MNKSRFSERVTLKAVVTKIKTIANEKYQDKVYENILPIFNSLTQVEKRTLLRGLINICFIVEDRIVIDNKALMEMKETVTTTGKEMKDQIHTIEEFNKLELIKLKSWVTKVVVGAVLVAMVGVVVVLTIFGTGNLSDISILEKIFKIFSVMFG